MVSKKILIKLFAICSLFSLSIWYLCKTFKKNNRLKVSLKENGQDIYLQTYLMNRSEKIKKNYLLKETKQSVFKAKIAKYLEKNEVNNF
jgi:hypothetical protein